MVDLALICRYVHLQESSKRLLTVICLFVRNAMLLNFLNVIFDSSTCLNFVFFRHGLSYKIHDAKCPKPLRQREVTYDSREAGDATTVIFELISMWRDTLSLVTASMLQHLCPVFPDASIDIKSPVCSWLPTANILFTFECLMHP